jgi:[ribosomal protein S5]-alanine N-acetyltransferase
MFSPASLHTSRLLFRPTQAGDAHALFAMYSDVEFMRYWSFAPMTHIDQVHARLAHVRQQCDAGDAVECALELRSTGDMIGTCALFHGVARCRRAELGFGLARSHWGHGFASEAIGALVAHAFTTLELNRLEADIDPRNLRSAATLERAGFVEEGLLRERWINDGVVSDSALYGLLARDWKQTA